MYCPVAGSSDKYSRSSGRAARAGGAWGARGERGARGQVLGDGHLGFLQALRFSEVPFPFPFAQTMQIVLCLLTLTAPLLCVVWLNSPWLVAAFAFCVNWIYWSLNEIDRCLEDPFLHPPHDFELPAVQRSRPARSRAPAPPRPRAPAPPRPRAPRAPAPLRPNARAPQGFQRAAAGDGPERRARARRRRGARLPLLARPRRAAARGAHRARRPAPRPALPAALAGRGGGHAAGGGGVVGAAGGRGAPAARPGRAPAHVGASSRRPVPRRSRRDMSRTLYTTLCKVLCGSGRGCRRRDGRTTPGPRA